jgi:hypothetical protein
MIQRKTYFLLVGVNLLFYMVCNWTYDVYTSINAFWDITLVVHKCVVLFEMSILRQNSILKMGAVYNSANSSSSSTLHDAITKGSTVSFSLPRKP